MSAKYEREINRYLGELPRVSTTRSILLESYVAVDQVVAATNVLERSKCEGRSVIERVDLESQEETKPHLPTGQQL